MIAGAWSAADARSELIGNMVMMMRRSDLRAVLMAATFAGAASIAGAAQKYEPLPPPLTVDPCAVRPNPRFPVAPDPKAKAPVCPPPGAAAGSSTAAPGATPPSSTQQFPFPGDVAPRAAASGADRPGGQTSPVEKFPYPGSAPLPATPAAGKSAGQFPYPGETSKSPDAVPEGDTPRYVPDSPAPGENGPAPNAAAPNGQAPNAPAPHTNAAGDDSSSSSSSSGDSSLPQADDRDQAATPDNGGDSKVAKSRRRLPKVSAQSADERVAEDLNVAKFYSGSGNFEAAYLRSKDAITVMPDDPESHFALAEAAQKLQKKDEAIAEYTLYLKMDSGGNHATAAQKALTGLR